MKYLKSKKEVRRHHEQRIKAYVVKNNYHGNFNGNFCIKQDDVDQSLRAKAIGRTAATKHPCSCLGCGNARKYYGRSIKELASIIDLEEQLGCLE